MIRFVENETGTEVTVETVAGWEPFPLCSIVTYPSGRQYVMADADLTKYFTIVSPQEVFITAYGGIDDRPTPKQKASADAIADTAAGPQNS